MLVQNLPRGGSGCAIRRCGCATSDLMLAVVRLHWRAALPSLLFTGLMAAIMARRKTRWWLRQRWLRYRLVERDTINAGCIRFVGGVDISYVKGSETDACAALIVCDLQDADCAVVHSAFRRVELTAPYIPGFLAFREVDFLLELLDELRRSAPQLLPEAILVDGNGILHPNRFGLACHLGVCAGIPTVGVGKSLHHVDGLTKETVRLLSGRLRGRGEHAELVGESGAIWGALLRTSEPAAGTSAFKPVVVSVGHGLSLRSSLLLVRRCTRHRIPEPVRQADLLSRQWLREHPA